MDIDLLKTFLEVNKTRHFGRAADSLYLTPAAVSARVRQLEQILGVDLFIRTRNNIQLTLEGERLVPHAETMLLSWSRALQDVALKSDQALQLNVGTTHSLWSFGLHQQLSKLFQMLPKAAIRAISHPSELLSRMLVERTLDLAFLLEPPTLADFKSEKIGQVKLVLVSNAPALNNKTALQSGYVYVDWGVSFEMFHAKRFGDLPKPVLHTNMGAIALDYLQHLPGSAYLPHSVLASEHPMPLHQIQGAPTFSRPLYAVYRSSSDRLEIVEEVLQLLKPLAV
jgi:DNA-binding transcriptional LysR family regulator